VSNQVFLPAICMHYRQMWVQTEVKLAL